MAVSESTSGSSYGPCSRCGKRVRVGAKSSPTPCCRECRAQTHGTVSRYDGGCRCGDCRSAKTVAAREYAARRREMGNPIKPSRPTVRRRCELCSVEFDAVEYNVRIGKGRFCGSRCANVWRNQSRVRRPRKVRPKVSAVRRRAGLRAAKAAAGTVGRTVWVAGPCALCREPFVFNQPAARYCSSACASKANRSATWFKVTYLDRLHVYERDGWTCHICTEKVDFQADPLSDWYPSLDHVVPRSRGGSDELSNLRTAHRWCNSVRGDLSSFRDGILLSA